MTDNDNQRIYIGQALKDVDISKQWAYVQDLLIANGGEGSEINADMLDGHHADYFMSKDELLSEAMLPGFYIGKTPIKNIHEPGKQYIYTYDMLQIYEDMMINIQEKRERDVSVSDDEAYIYKDLKERLNELSGGRFGQSFILESLLLAFLKYSTFYIEWLKAKRGFGAGKNYGFSEEDYIAADKDGVEFLKKHIHTGIISNPEDAPSDDVDITTTSEGTTFRYLSADAVNDLVFWALTQQQYDNLGAETKAQWNNIFIIKDNVPEHKKPLTITADQAFKLFLKAEKTGDHEYDIQYKTTANDIGYVTSGLKTSTFINADTIQPSIVSLKQDIYDALKAIAPIITTQYIVNTEDSKQIPLNIDSGKLNITPLFSNYSKTTHVHSDLESLSHKLNSFDTTKDKTVCYPTINYLDTNTKVEINNFHNEIKNEFVNNDSFEAGIQGVITAFEELLGE